MNRVPIQHSAAKKWLALLAVGIAWGATAPLSKLAVSGGHHPIGIAFWGAVIAAVVLTSALLLKHRPKHWGMKPWNLGIERRHLTFFVIAGILGTVFPDIATYTAYQHLPVGIIVLCYASIPIVTLALSAIFGMEGLTRTRLTGIVLGSVAMVLIALPNTDAPRGSWFWVALPILAAISYACENLFISARRPGSLGSLEVMVGLTIAAVILFAPMVFLMDAHIDLTDAGPSEYAIVLLALFHVAAYFGYIWLIEQAGSVFTAQLSYVVTGSGILFGILLYNETYGLSIWLALVLMFIGLTLVRPKA